MHDVVIVGGGPVGLYTAILLRQAGLDVVVLERRTRRSSHSRAIGIHPPALAALEAAGVSDELTARGVRITHGIARSGGRHVTELSFASLPGRHRFVLAVPQAVTEEVLERRLEATFPGTLRRGIKAIGTAECPGHVVTTVEQDGQPASVESRLLIGADGAKSSVREFAGIGASGRTYPDRYLMGDFPDTSGDGSAAVLYLEPHGIVESFPLPGGIRRWVVRTGSPGPEPTVDALAALVSARTGIRLDRAGNTMLSAFGVRSQIADRFVAGRITLLGDAAHEISPIGGQGMNLGWLDAGLLTPVIVSALRDGVDVGRQVERFNTTRRREAVLARRRAHVNMALGRPLAPATLRARNAAVAGLLSLPAARSALASTFTMQ